MTIEEIWDRYKSTNNIEFKQKLIEEYVYLVKIVAGRLYNYYNGNIEFDDLLSYGVFGLIDAIEKFDINRGLKFETYAQIRIRGAIIDNLRKLDWIPRSLRKKAKALEEVVRELENNLGRTVTYKDVAKKLNIDQKEVEELFKEISIYNIVSLEDIFASGNDIVFRDSYDTPEGQFEKKEIKSIIRETIDKLPEKEKLVISLYYYDELTYKEISEILGVSQSRISQLHSKALTSIKSKLKHIGILS
ncbi:RNA polymerase sigma factor WhiG [Caloranaerobacter sp. TR13]|uniref:sigma-70 family RNA polymerase sigma factor n=1 Tax=Caloranaerobacter sp. TR13 TaxID=1302151 RepID=UPI0006D43E57|nr:FliA/WhiG family RNA polymerase sigma factor [Caloranaerobacter sp. TR13]KPU28192.1 RNA polymerase sigma factor WhiG [Caloranaerobacter sp. TR13]